MKLLTLFLAAAPLASALPHGPDEDSHGAAAPAPVSAPAAPEAAKKSTTTPAGCNRLYSDVDWPEEAVWKKSFREIEPRSKNLAKGVQRPDFKVRAQNYEDVQKAVKFAAENKIRLTVITSGHDFLGRNDAPSGLSLDVSLLGGVRVHSQFTPTANGAPKPGKVVNSIIPQPGKQAAVTFGVGLTTQKLNNAIHSSKLVTVGAAHGSVATAGGYGQTAGHGPLSSLYGLAVDNFLEFKVVTADGELKVANKVSNPDLFWALRGGGGSTFGVVVEATVKAHPDIPITLTAFSFNTTTNNTDGLWDAYAYLNTQFPTLSENGVMGYYYIYPNSIKSIFLGTGKAQGKANSAKLWDPILAKMASFSGLTKPGVTVSDFDSYKAYFDARFGAVDKPHMVKRHGPGMEDGAPEAQGIAPLDSRLLGAEHFKHPNLTALLRAAAPKYSAGSTPGALQGHLVGGGKVWKPEDETSVHPAWRKAYTHVITYKQPGPGGADSLRVLAPESGAYANEAYPWEENWKQQFWGEHYEKLSQIKTKYDPNLVFWASPGINADHAEVRDGRVCRVTGKTDSKIAPKTDSQNPQRLMTGNIN